MFVTIITERMAPKKSKDDKNQTKTMPSVKTEKVRPQLITAYHCSDQGRLLGLETWGLAHTPRSGAVNLVKPNQDKIHK